MQLMLPLIADSAAFLLLLLPLIAVSAAFFMLSQPLCADSAAPLPPYLAIWNRFCYTDI